MAGQNVGRACGAGRRLAQPCLVLGIASLCSVLYTGSRTLTRLGYSLAQFDNPLPVGPYATLAGGFTGIAIGIRSWLFPVTTAGRLQVTFDIHSAYRIIAAAVGKRRSPAQSSDDRHHLNSGNKRLPRSLGGRFAAIGL